MRKDLAALVNGSCAGPRTIEKMDVLLGERSSIGTICKMQCALGLPAASWQGGQARLVALQLALYSRDADIERYAPQP